MMQYEMVDILKRKTYAEDYNDCCRDPVWRWCEEQERKMSYRKRTVASLNGLRAEGARRTLEDQRTDDKKNQTKEVYTEHYTTDTEYICQWGKCGGSLKTKCKLKTKILN